MKKISDFDVKAKANRFKKSAAKKAGQCVNWISDNRDIVIALAPIIAVGISGATGVVKNAMRRSNLSKEQELKDLYQYDRSAGRYWKTKRRLTTSESLEVERRRANDEKLGNILASMKLLDKRY